MGFSLVVLDDRPGFIVLEISGKNALERFKHESGGHRWQRVPPTERHGRRQTSTITVAVMQATREADVKLLERDIEWQATRGSGAGGQARNKTSNAVMMKHTPSGLAVRVESERSQSQNREAARRLLAARLLAREQDAQTSASASARKAQVGSGQRGDKRRTIRTQDDSVVDHVTGKRTTVARYEKGYLEDIVG